MLPPLNAIRAFDAAARHMSFKLAAEELNVTPTAISHQIKQLETWAGKTLFIRSARKVKLTTDGLDFSREIEPVFRTLQKAYTRLCEIPNRACVTLGISSLFAARWLAPKLGDFWEKHPDIDLKFFHSHLPIWQQSEHYDVAIAWGTGKWGELNTRRFLSVEASPVLSTDLYKRIGPFKFPEDTLSAPLLHFRNKSNWLSWFEAAGATVEPELDGTVFEDANVELQATLSGRGISLGNFPLVDEEIALGRLIRPFKTTIEMDYAYFLILPENTFLPPESEALVNWLLDQINQE
ncbi:MAG: LysR substrate-binding domain-containing protein [Pseudomonadota bacterium]